MEKIETATQTEKVLDDGLTVLIKDRTLYHGSSVAGLEKLNGAEETTVGEGVYFTSDSQSASGYAKRRALNRGGSEVVYEAKIENLKLADLRTDSNVKKILEGFLPVLVRKTTQENLPWNTKMILDTAIENIRAGTVGVRNLRDVVFSLSKSFTEHLTSLGYDGLVTLEGGEGDEIGNHDSYLIFNPDNVKIHVQEK